MHSKSLTLGLLAATAGYASASSALSKKASQEPCAIAANQINGGAQTIDPATALACLQSVPVDTKADVVLVEGLIEWLEFQSTLPYLQDPPPGWLYPGADLPGSLALIAQKIANGGYSSEYDVQVDIESVFISAHDFHVVYESDILHIFSWSRGTEQLISVSTDGTSLPDVYMLSDLDALTGNTNSYTASPVSTINSVEVEQWINEYAAINPWDHDPDVNYNYVMYNSVAGNLITTQYQNSSFQVVTGASYPGASTAIKFVNGTTVNIPTIAIVNNNNWQGVTNGQTFFNVFCTGNPPQATQPAAPSSTAPSRKRSPQTTTFTISSAAASSTSLAASVQVTTENSYLPASSSAPVALSPSTFPRPVVIADDQSIGGYFVDGIPDLAVLSVPTFGPVDDDEFQDDLRTFLATAKSLNKTRLIIDLRANGGGTVGDGYDMFKQLFPSYTPQDQTNWRATPLLNLLGSSVSSAVASGNISNDDLGSLTQLNYQVDINPQTNKTYSSWSQVYGPVSHYGGEFSNLHAYNLSTYYNGLNTDVYGYVNDTNPQPQTFTSDNMVVLSDGSCGSTCAVFMEFMKTQGQVKSITVGGRKQNGPSQPVGGSKGANDQNILYFAQGAYTASQLYPAAWKSYIQGGLLEAWQIVLNRTDQTCHLNFANNIRKGDSSATPLMFVYEASNCRFFYTPSMINNQSAVWEMTYNLQWGNAQCIQDSTGQPSAQLGFDTSYINSSPPAGANNSFGAAEVFSYPGAYTVGQTAPAASVTSALSAISVVPSNSASGTAAAHATTSSSKAGAERTAVPLMLMAGAVAALL